MSDLPGAVQAAVIHDLKAAETKVAVLAGELAELKARCNDLPRRIEHVCDQLVQEQARIAELVAFMAEHEIPVPETKEKAA